MDEGSKTINILLVDDDDVDTKSITRAIRKAKILNPIYRAVDGIDALALLRGEGEYEVLPKPYILIVDLKMPRMDGIEFIQELREDEKLKSSVVFVLSTSKHDEEKMAAYNLNVAGYIVKERAGSDFARLVELIVNYWRIVELP
ncbi:MAG: response regulator [Methyloligellaceae bacterium]